MKIAIFTETYLPFTTGVVTHISLLKKWLEETGHQVMIVTLDPAVYKNELIDGVLHCPAFPLKKIYGFGIANPLNRKRLAVIKDFNPDIIHLHTEFTMGLFALLTARQLKKPTVYTLHTLYDDYVYYLFPKLLKKLDTVAKPIARAYIKNVANRATQIIGPSPKVVEYLRWCGVKKHINIIPNTVDLTEFSPHNVKAKTVTLVKKQLEIKPNDITACFVGRLGQEKSLDTLIKYFHQSVKHLPNFKLFIIGDGPEKSNLQQLINKLGAQKQIFLLGTIIHHHLPVYYQAFDLYLTASLSEMHSMVLLEALASGLYCFLRFDPFSKGQINSGVSGDFFHDQKQLATALTHYYHLTPAKRQKIRQQVITDAKRFHHHQFIDSVIKVYLHALRQTKSS
jgi:1,2-diacylglycerol 3-alpha-glucosyltransferase